MGVYRFACLTWIFIIVIQLMVFDPRELTSVVIKSFERLVLAL